MLNACLGTVFYVGLLTVCTQVTSVPDDHFCCIRYRGVRVQSNTYKSNTYKSNIRSEGKNHYLGAYTTPQEAARVYDEACVYLVSQQTRYAEQIVHVTNCMTWSCGFSHS